MKDLCWRMEWEKEKARQTKLKLDWKEMHLHGWLNPIIPTSHIFIYLISSHHDDDAEHAAPPILE